jgi:hypothetical protein
MEQVAKPAFWADWQSAPRPTTNEDFRISHDNEQFYEPDLGKANVIFDE